MSLRARGAPLLSKARVDVADPFVLAVDGAYFLYHTGHAIGVPVYRSDDLINWTRLGLALAPDPEIPWAACDFWAPEVVFRDGQFFLYVAVAATLPDGSPDDERRRLAVARSDDPAGPFTMDPEPLTGDEWAIDAHPFQDDDGSWWLFYNARNDDTRYRDGTIGCGNAVVALPQPDRVAGERHIVLVPSERWEGNADGSWYWNEGAFVVRRGGRLLQTYSGGWFADGTYAIGVATAERPEGPWHKNVDNPLLVSSREVAGPGHNCIVTAPDGFTSVLVYHAHRNGRRRRSAFSGELHWVGDGFVVTGQSPARPTAGTYEPAIPFWRIDATLRAGSYRFSDDAVTTAHPATLEIRSTPDGVHGRLDGRPLPVSLTSVDACLEAIGQRASFVRVRSGLNDATERTLAAGEALTIPWAPGVPTVLNVVVAGEGRLDFGDDSVACTSVAPELHRIESVRGGTGLRITATGTLHVSGVEMVPSGVR